MYGVISTIKFNIMKEEFHPEEENPSFLYRWIERNASVDSYEVDVSFKRDRGNIIVSQ